MIKEPTFVMFLVWRDRTQGRLASLEGVQISLEQCDWNGGEVLQVARLELVYRYRRSPSGR